MTTTLAVGEILSDVRDEWDLWYAFIIGLPALVAAITTLRNRAEFHKHRKNLETKTESVLYEVRNSHSENLRDEITRGFKEIRDDLRVLRDELLTERKERIDGDKAREEDR